MGEKVYATALLRYISLDFRFLFVIFAESYWITMDRVDILCISGILGAISGAFIGILMLIGSLKDSNESDIIFTITFDPKDQDKDSKEPK